MPAFSRLHTDFERADAQVLGISVDSVPCNTAWEKSLGTLNYPLLSDFWPHGAMAERYGVLRDEGYTERAIIVVDKSGRIRYIDVHRIDEAPAPEPILDLVKSL